MSLFVFACFHIGLIVQHHHQELLNEFAFKNAEWLRELLYHRQMISEAERAELANCRYMIDHSSTVVDIMIRRDSIEYVVSMLRFLRTNGFSFSSDMISDVQRRYKGILKYNVFNFPTKITFNYLIFKLKKLRF